MSGPRVIVIGGGAIGLTSSLYLAREGYEVLLLEARRLFSGASGSNLGILSYQLAVVDGLSPGEAREAILLHEALSEDTGYSIVPRDIVVPLRHTLAVIPEYLRVLHRLIRVGASLRRVGSHGLSIVMPNALLIDPGEYAERLLKTIRSEGVEILENTRATGLIVEGGRISGVTLDSGEHVKGDIVLVAAGPWTDEILSSIGVKLGIRALKGYRITAKVKRELDYVIGADPVFIRPHQERRDEVLIGGYKIEAPLTAGDLVDYERVESMLGTARKLGLEIETVIETKAGLRPCLEKPITGTLGWRGLVVSTGHCRHGMLLAPLAASRVVALVKRLLADAH